MNTQCHGQLTGFYALISMLLVTCMLFYTPTTSAKENTTEPIFSSIDHVQFARRHRHHYRHHRRWDNRYYGPRYISIGYWTGWRKVSRRCYRKCFINVWGERERCVRRCR